MGFIRHNKGVLVDLKRDTLSHISEIKRKLAICIFFSVVTFNLSSYLRFAEDHGKKWKHIFPMLMSSKVVYIYNTYNSIYPGRSGKTWHHLWENKFWDCGFVPPPPSLNDMCKKMLPLPNETIAANTFQVGRRVGRRFHREFVPG